MKASILFAAVRIAVFMYPKDGRVSIQHQQLFIRSSQGFPLRSPPASTFLSQKTIEEKIRTNSTPFQFSFHLTWKTASKGRSTWLEVPPQQKLISSLIHPVSHLSKPIKDLKCPVKSQGQRSKWKWSCRLLPQRWAVVQRCSARFAPCPHCTTECSAFLAPNCMQVRRLLGLFPQSLSFSVLPFLF